MLNNPIKSSGKDSVNRKGIVLAGGSGSRLFPLTKGICKQLLPVYDKPMIYYPLSLLMLSGVREILVISTKNDLPIIERMLGDGANFGINISYAVQPTPDGLAQAFIIGESFIGGCPAALVLGDNLLFGQNLTRLLVNVSARSGGATIFGYKVKNPSAFGVAEIDNDGNVMSLEEKPEHPKSNLAIPGLYFYDATVCQRVKTLKPSSRGELEITDLNRLYLAEKSLTLEVLGRGTAWLDMGTHESLYRAASYVESIQSIQGYQIANLEEIAFRNGWISSGDLESYLTRQGQSGYSQYLRDLIKDLNN